MATREKIFIPNEIYYITFTILGWKSVFIKDEYCDLAYKWFDYIRKNYGNKIHGYVIMPSHLHVLIYITDKSPILSKLMQNAKRFLAYEIVALLMRDHSELLDYFAGRAETKKNAKHKIFKDRYDSKIIQTDKMLLEKLNYIHNNPCQAKWRLSGEPEDYKYSSAANYIKGRGFYEVDLLDF
ncbi:MAG: transposase [bacterium]|nr:transposase [bacterium]